jgi:hypothetical protein
MSKRSKQPNQRKETIMHGGNRQVTKDGAGESQITDADLQTFMALKNAPPSNAAWQFIIGKHHIGKDGKPVAVAEDMRQHPAKYGFADSASAAEWQGSVELAK